MSRFRSVFSSPWYGVALTGLAGLAAAAWACASRRSTADSIIQLTRTIDDLNIFVRKVDYWTVYEQAQKDLLLGDDDRR